MDWLVTQPKIGDVQELYENLWGQKPAIQLPEIGDPDPPTTTAEVLTVITAKDTQYQMKRSTAAGPDGVTRRDTCNQATQEVLQLPFNMLMVVGRQPSAWRKNRTILLPKEGKDPRLMANFRPVTVCSIMPRIYWGITDSKVRTVVQFKPDRKGLYLKLSASIMCTS